MVQKTPTRLLTTTSPDAPVDSTLLDKAMVALLKNHQKTAEESTSLLGSDLPVQVQFTLVRVPENTSSRPICLDIPHPLHKLITDENDENDDDMVDDGLDDVEVCLIVKDEAKQLVLDLIQKFPSHLSYIKKVLTLTSLRKKHSQYADRRELVQRYDLFLADDRILPMLGKALGKSFFQQKKQPVPIKVTRKEALPFAVKRCLRGTFMWVSAGTCITIKAGNTAMPTQYLKENVESIVKNAVSHIPRRWANISAICIKTSNSIALPIYNKTREDLLEIAYLHQIAKKEAANEKKREISAQSEEEEDTDRDKKKRKVNADKEAKSPLLKAIKAIHSLKSRDEKNKEESDKSEDKNTGKAEEKKKRKKKKTRASANETQLNQMAEDDKNDKYASSGTEKSTSSAKKQKIIKVGAETSSSPENKKEKNESSLKKSDSTGRHEFIASRKFKGAKSGYVFKKGEKGVGYYIDVKPIPSFDMVVRSNRSGGKFRSKSPGSKRRKSVGGRKRR